MTPALSRDVFAHNGLEHRQRQGSEELPLESLLVARVQDRYGGSPPNAFLFTGFPQFRARLPRRSADVAGL